MQTSSYGGAYPNAFSIFSGSTHNHAFLESIDFGRESYTRTMWFTNPAHERIKQWGVIGNGRANKITTISEMKARSEGAESGSFMGGINLFYTPNQFFGWRKSQLLSQFHANYLDIDTTGHGVVTPAVSKKILNDVLTQLSVANVPAPNAIVSSGSGGWHIYWLYKPIPGYKRNQYLWREMASKLVSSIDAPSYYTVDAGASTDPTRLLRLPGSFHLQAETQCDCHYLSDLYEFDSLRDALEVELFTPAPSKSKTKRTQKRENTGQHTFKDYYSKIYWELLNVANDGKLIRPKNGNAGNRDMFLYLSMVCLHQIMGCPEKSFEEVLKLNDRYGLFVGNGPDAGRNKVGQYLSSCFKNRYGYAKSKIIKIFRSHFNTEIEHVFAVKKTPLSPKEVKIRQAKSAIATHQARILKTRDKITDALKKAHSDGLKPSMSLIAKLAGITARTVSNHKKFYQSVVDEIWSVTIYTPPG